MDRTGVFLLPHGFKAELLNSVLKRGLLLKRVEKKVVPDAPLHEVEEQLKQEVKEALKKQEARKKFDCKSTIFLDAISFEVPIATLSIRGVIKK